MTDQDQAHPSTLIRQSEFLQRAVLDRTTLEELGRVEVLWMFPQVNRVLGIVVKPGWFGANRLVFKLPQIKTAKAQILVQGAAEETTLDKVHKLESLIGTAVWSEGGDRLGTITDCLFDLNSGVIIRYLMVPDSQFPQLITQLTDGLYLISPKQIQSFSRQRVLIADETVDQLRLYSEGLRLKLATMTAQLKQDYWDGATEEWRSLSYHVQSIAQQAADQVKTLAEKAQSLSKNLAQKVSETVTDKVEQVEEAIADDDSPWNDPEWVDTVTDTVKTKGQEMVSQVKERSQPVVHRFKTLQQTVKTSVVSRLNSLSDSPNSDDTDPEDLDPGDRHPAPDSTISAGLDDERLDDERLDDERLDDERLDDGELGHLELEWDDEDFTTEHGESHDPWDDWEDHEDVDSPRPVSFQPQTPGRSQTKPTSPRATYSAPPMADPWDTHEL